MTPYNYYPRVSLYECRCKNCGWTSHEILKNRLWEIKTRTYRHKPLPAFVKRRKYGKSIIPYQPKGFDAPKYKQRRLTNERLMKIVHAYRKVL